jgi:hypothetical protein
LSVSVVTVSNGLCSAFNQIEESSEKLLKKGPMAIFTDKGSDSKVVAGLIERLREAIIYYQVSDNYILVFGIVDKGNRYHSSKQSTIKSLTLR